MPTIHHGNCIETMKAMPPESVDAIVCDPPYGLSNTDPGSVADTITKWASGDRDHVPTGRGFMGKSWDAFVPPPAVWDECMRVLKPGGHMVVFAGSRTQDLMGLSIRLAGFEVRDSLAWLYGSGFPKSMNVGKAIDKAAGAERKVIGQSATVTPRSGKSSSGFAPLRSVRWGDVHYSWEDAPSEARAYFEAQGATRGQITAPATPEAAQWDGWGTALKPAFEPIVLARKPLAEKTVARNVLAHGTGAINVDACRIGMSDDDRSLVDSRSGAGFGTGHTVGARQGRAEGKFTSAPGGRWPANVLLDHHAAAWVDEQSGVSKSTQSIRVRAGSVFGNGLTLGSAVSKFDSVGGFEDAGGASRFFYTAKAPKSERPNVDGVQHPTVKPLAIMRWLIRLVTPPGGTVLDPFAGSGTTIEAALIEGFDPVGIEMETDYLPLIQHRIDRQAGTLPA